MGILWPELGFPGYKTAVFQLSDLGRHHHHPDCAALGSAVFPGSKQGKPVLHHRRFPDRLHVSVLNPHARALSVPGTGAAPVCLRVAPPQGISGGLFRIYRNPPV